MIILDACLFAPNSLTRVLIFQDVCLDPNDDDCLSNGLLPTMAWYNINNGERKRHAA